MIEGTASVCGLSDTPEEGWIDEADASHLNPLDGSGIGAIDTYAGPRTRRTRMEPEAPPSTGLL